MQSPSRSWLAAGILLLVGLVLRVPRLTQSIWFDEAFRTFVVLKAENARSILLHDVHNPLYNACMYIWIRVFGDSDFASRPFLRSLFFARTSGRTIRSKKTYRSGVSR
jgi:hypothetical protein